MLTPRLTNCAQCDDICSLIDSIDCKVAEMSVSLYNNVVFMLNKSFDHELLSDLLNYKRILQYKVCNPNYAGCFTVNMIASKVRRFTSGCIKDCSCRISSVETTTSTSTLAPITTSTTSTIPPSTTTTSTSSGNTTTSTTTLISCCNPPTTLALPGSTILFNGVNLTFSSTKPAGLQLFPLSVVMYLRCIPWQVMLGELFTGGDNHRVDWDYTINFDQPVNDVKIQIVSYAASSVPGFQIDEKITFTTNTQIPEVINCDACNVIIESNSIRPVMDTGGSGAFIINTNDPYTSLTLTPTMLGPNPGGRTVAVFIRICGLTIAP
jgi:hypothetical protein